MKVSSLAAVLAFAASIHCSPSATEEPTGSTEDRQTSGDAPESAAPFAIHDPGGEHLMTRAGKQGYIVFNVYLANPEWHSYTPWINSGFTPIVRVNFGGGHGPLPCPTDAGDVTSYLDSLGHYVSETSGARLWVIANEGNHPGEPMRCGDAAPRPITPQEYGNLYKQARLRIRSQSGHGLDRVLTSAPSPGPQPGIPNWLTYFTDMLHSIGPGSVDGFALHAYTTRNDASLVSSDAVDGLGNHTEFRAYRDALQTLTGDLAWARGLPSYITEAAPPSWSDVNTGWVAAAHRDVASWNVANPQSPVRAIAIYRWRGIDQWSFGNQKGAQNDLLATMGYNGGDVDVFASLMGHACGRLNPDQRGKLHPQDNTYGCFVGDCLAGDPPTGYSWQRVSSVPFNELVGQPCGAAGDGRQGQRHPNAPQLSCLAGVSPTGYTWQYTRP